MTDVPRLTVYEKPTCTTCRRLAHLLDSRGIDFDRVDHHVEGLSEDQLRRLLTKAGAVPRDFLRVKEPPCWAARIGATSARPGNRVPRVSQDDT